jgi:hypothetical protein
VVILDNLKVHASARAAAALRARGPVVGYGHYVRHGVENPALYRLITWVGPQ